MLERRLLVRKSNSAIEFFSMSFGIPAAGGGGLLAGASSGFFVSYKISNYSTMNKRKKNENLLKDPFVLPIHQNAVLFILICPLVGNVSRRTKS